MEEEFKPIICMTCLNVKSYKNFTVMKGPIKNSLDFLLLRLPLGETNKSMICDACYAKLYEAVHFKTICIDTENSLPNTNLKNGIPINLKQIYLKKSDNEQFKNVLENERICRLCMQKMTSGFTSIEDIEMDLIRIYIPEVNFKSTADPVVCSNCLESLKMHGGFLRNCLDVQKFENVCEDEVMDIKPDIKVEEIELKTEEDDKDMETSVSPDEPADCKSKAKEDPNTPPLEIQKYECNMCSYRTNIKHCFSSHQLKHKTLSEVVTYQCGICDFRTKYKRNLLGHQLTHKEASEIQMYRCDKCSFETKRKSTLSSHQLIHKDRPKVYKCDTCDYETWHEKWLTRHSILHKDVSEIQIYKCDICSYENRYKENLAHHLLVRHHLIDK